MKSSRYFVFNHSVLQCPDLYSVIFTIDAPFSSLYSQLLNLPGLSTNLNLNWSSLYRRRTDNTKTSYVITSTVALWRHCACAKVCLPRRCVTQQLVIDHPVPTVAWRGLHRKHSFLYCCVMYHAYWAAAWQRVDQICYNTHNPIFETLHEVYTE
jgi:hypothetical protein